MRAFACSVLAILRWPSASISPLGFAFVAWPPLPLDFFAIVAPVLHVKNCADQTRIRQPDPSRFRNVPSLASTGAVYLPPISLFFGSMPAYRLASSER